MEKPTSPVKVSKAEQRVIIAKDALAQLKAEKLVAIQGLYIGYELYDHLSDGANGNDTLQAQPFLKKALQKTGSCRVCAKGALFLSAVQKYNKATIDDVMCDNMEVAENIFGEKQWNLIEAAFEQWEEFPFSMEGQGESVPPKALEFGQKYEDDNERLQAILKNIIANDGIFKP